MEFDFLLLRQLEFVGHSASALGEMWGGDAEVADHRSINRHSAKGGGGANVQGEKEEEEEGGRDQLSLRGPS